LAPTPLGYFGIFAMLGSKIDNEKSNFLSAMQPTRRPA